MWVDRNFTHSVLSGVYNFEASASAYMQFWNDCTSVTDFKVQNLVSNLAGCFQGSIRTIASVNNKNLELPEKLPIEAVANKHLQN